MVGLAGVVVIGVTELAPKSPRLGALILSLPLVSMLAFIMTWLKFGDMAVIAPLAKDTLILVPLGLPFFLPFAFYDRLRLSFWSAFLAGTVLAAICLTVFLVRASTS